MFFYCSLLFLVIILAGRYRIYNFSVLKKFKIYFVYILLSIVSILRFDVGWDYPAYYSFFIPKFDLKTVEKIELIPRLFAFVANYLNSPFVFFFLFACFTYFFIFDTIEKFSDCKFESIIIYFCVFYFDSFGIIRQAFAYALVFWGYRFIKGKCIHKYIVVCLIAFFIHKSAILAILIYFIFNYCKIIPTIIVTFIIYLGKKIVLEKLTVFNFYIYYLNNLDKFLGGNKIQYFYVIIIFFLLAIYFITYTRGCINRDKNEIEGLFSVLIFGSVMPFLLGAMGLRLALYFDVFLLLLWPKVLKHFTIQSKVAFISLFYLYFVMFMNVSSNNIEKSPYTPYRIYFMTDKSIMKK